MFNDKCLLFSVQYSIFNVFFSFDYIMFYTICLVLNLQWTMTFFQCSMCQRGEFGRIYKFSHIAVAVDIYHTNVGHTVQAFKLAGTLIDMSGGNRVP